MRNLKAAESAPPRVLTTAQHKAGVATLDTRWLPHRHSRPQHSQPGDSGEPEKCWKKGGLKLSRSPRKARSVFALVKALSEVKTEKRHLILHSFILEDTDSQRPFMHNYPRIVCSIFLFSMPVLYVTLLISAYFSTYFAPLLSRL